MSAETINVAVTGAAGQIGYALIPELLNGWALEPEQINLKLLETPEAVGRLEGLAMELEDLACPNLASLDITDDPAKAFNGVNFAFMVGSRPRSAGMDRAQLLEVNAPIFVAQGRALNDHAASDVHALVVGNPANSNALVALSNAPDIPVERFSAMSRLDHNRALAKLAGKLIAPVEYVDGVIVWGNHSDKMVLDISEAWVDYGDEAAERLRILQDSSVEIAELERAVALRGGAVMEARGASSALSAANATAEQTRDWMRGSDDAMHSMAVYSHGEYDTPQGVVYSFPVTSRVGSVEIIEDIELTERVRAGLRESGIELEQERAKLRELGFLAVER